MCNLSDGVYLDGVKQGIMQGKAEGVLQGEARGIEKGRFEMIKKFIQKGNTFENALDMFDITDKNEIEFLRENL